MNIRPVNPSDTAEWLRMRMALWPDSDSGNELDEINRFLASPEHTCLPGLMAAFVCPRAGGGLCGLVEVSIRPYADGCETNDVGYLEAWYVDPTSATRGSGGTWWKWRRIGHAARGAARWLPTQTWITPSARQLTENSVTPKRDGSSSSSNHWEFTFPTTYGNGEGRNKMSDQKMKISPRVLIQMLFFIVIVPFLPLLISRDWGWWEAWVYAIVSILGFVISRVLAGRRNPGLLRERARFLQHEDAKPWDKTLAPLVGLGGALIPLVAGIDALFAGPPPFNLAMKLISLAMILAGYSLGSYALIENRFFSGMVRIQTERGHQVISSGPYGWMRHPGYAGALLTYLATPFFLDSLWAILPAVFLTIVLVVRTSLEDRTLQEELPGYKDYAGRVRFRLIPGIW